MRIESLESRQMLALTPAIALGLGAYTQDFDTLAISGTSSTTPNGWGFSEGDANANLLYTAGTGSSNIGDTYSFGATGSSERAFGALQTGTLNSTMGAAFTNNTGTTISSLNVAYTGEQWRLGTADANIDALDFEISTNATSLTTGTWTAVNTLDFVSPNNTTTGALDGNAVGNKTAISSSISGLSIAPGATFYIRWIGRDIAGSQDGLAIDDVKISVALPPILSALSISPTVIAEGQSVTVAGSIYDAETPETFAITLNWGDGSGNQTYNFGAAAINAGGVVWNPSTRAFSINRIYADDNPTGTAIDTNAISVVSLTDSDGDAAVLNSAPTITGFTDISGGNGNDYSTTFATQWTLTNRITLNTDSSGIAHSHSGIVNIAFDVHNPVTNTWTEVFTQNLSSGSQVFLNGMTATFPTQLVDAVRLRSNPGQFLTYHFNSSASSVTFAGNTGRSISVSNDAPNILGMAWTSSSINEESTATLSGTFSDAGLGADVITGTA